MDIRKITFERVCHAAEVSAANLQSWCNEGLRLSAQSRAIGATEEFPQSSYTVVDAFIAALMKALVDAGITVSSAISFVEEVRLSIENEVTWREREGELVQAEKESVREDKFLFVATRQTGTQFMTLQGLAALKMLTGSTWKETKNAARSILVVDLSRIHRVISHRLGDL